MGSAKFKRNRQRTVGYTSFAKSSHSHLLDAALDTALVPEISLKPDHTPNVKKPSATGPLGSLVAVLETLRLRCAL